MAPKGTVIVRADTYILRGRVSSLSPHGLEAMTTSTAPERLLGCAAEVALRLDGGGASWLALRGRIARIGSCAIAIELQDAHALAAVLDGIQPDLEAHGRGPAVVIVDGLSGRRTELAGQLRAAGWTVVDAATPLEAIVRLGEAGFEPDVIAIADSVPSTISDELRRFVEAEHPAARLVVVGDGTSGAGIDDVISLSVE